MIESVLAGLLDLLCKPLSGCLRVCVCVCTCVSLLVFAYSFPLCACDVSAEGGFMKLYQTKCFTFASDVDVMLLFGNYRAPVWIKLCLL